MVNGNGAFAMLPSLTVERGAEGISVTKNHPELKAAVTAALQQMIDDGTYLTILKKDGCSVRRGHQHHRFLIQASDKAAAR